MAHVLVVDDEWMVRESIAAALTRDGHEVRLAATGGAGLAAARAAPPEILVLDLRLPDLDGVSVVRGLRPRYAGPIIVCSAVTEESSRIRALDAGADDYLTKPFGMDELRARMRALLRRSNDGGTGPVTMLDLEVDAAERRLSVAGRPVRLTPTEWRLLEALSSRPGRLTSYPWLVHRVWGEHHGLETRQTLRTHVRSLRRKLDDDAGAPTYIATEQDAGYRWLVMPETSGTGGATDPAEDPTGAEVAPPETARHRTTRDDPGHHELDNALTALRFAAYLARSRLTTPATRGATCDDPPAGSLTDRELGDRLQAVVLRVCELAAGPVGAGTDGAGEEVGSS